MSGNGYIDLTSQKPDIFLGGTCNDTTWREDLIKLLDPEITYFNPVVDAWDIAAQIHELEVRKKATHCVYTITPKMIYTYAIAEAVDDSNKRPKKTLFCVLHNDGDSEFTPGQIRSLQRVMRMVSNNGGETFSSLESVAEYLNKI
jgi:hypothetical protein